MKLKSICYFIMISLLCLSVCSCKDTDAFQHYEDICTQESTLTDKEAGTLQRYEVYVCNQESSLSDNDLLIEYNPAKQTYTLPEIKSYKKSNMPEREILFGSDALPLEYNRTCNLYGFEYYVDSYYNNEYSIRVDYYENTETLAGIILGTYKYKITDTAITDNDTLLEVCSAFLSDYITDLSIYTTSTTTWIQYIDEHGVENDTLNGFREVKGDNEKITYRVDFNYQIDGIETAENINISVTSDGYLRTLSMNMIGEFHKYSKEKIDIERCNQLISKEVASLCNIENYNYEGYTDEKILVLLDDQLCLLSYVSPKLTKQKEEIHTHTIELLIPINN